jgi:flagellar hook assembly protein FlgD
MGLQLSGNHTLQWDGRNQSGQPVAAGTYFYQLQAGEVRQAGKVLLVR